MIPVYEKNNKEDIPFGQYMEQYQKLDPQEAAERTGIPYDEKTNCFRVRMLQKEYDVSWPDLEIARTDLENTDYAVLECETAAKILLIRFLLHGVMSQSTGNYVTYREVPSGEVYFRQFSGRCLSRLAYGFGFTEGRLAAAFERLGAKWLPYGDVSYELEIINNYFVRFILWTGDDEFPPSTQMLFSDNFPLSFTPEDMAVVGDISINTLKKM
ncbi:MAG: DUF3786 domain-containing protein [Eubacteriales bacterium]|nr:DUF3786 domain-containing protein [Eubacteriales bacterium]